MNQNNQHTIWLYAASCIKQQGVVTIPGIGMFTAQVSSAKLDPVANLYYPPGKTILFNETETNNLNDFASKIAKKYQLLLSDVIENINLEVERFKQELTENNTIEIDGFGTFKGKPGFLNFKPSNSLLLYVPSFGLPAIRCKANSVQTKKITIDKKPIEDIGDVDQIRINALAELKELLDNAQVAQAQENKKTSKVFPIIATVLTLILLVNVLIFLNKNTLKPLQDAISLFDMGGNVKEVLKDSNSANNSNEAINLIPLAEPTIENTETYSFDSIAMHIGSAIINKQPFNSFVEPTVTEEAEIISEVIEEVSVENSVQPNISDLPVIASNNKVGSNNNIKIAKDIPVLVANASDNNIEKGFYVIAGVFGSFNNAKALNKALKEKGFNYTKIIKPKYYKYNLVVFQKFSNKDDAYEAHEVFALQNPEAWIYEAR